MKKIPVINNLLKIRKVLENCIDDNLFYAQNNKFKDMEQARHHFSSAADIANAIELVNATLEKIRRYTL